MVSWWGQQKKWLGRKPGRGAQRAKAKAAQSRPAGERR